MGRKQLGSVYVLRNGKRYKDFPVLEGANWIGRAEAERSLVPVDIRIEGDPYVSRVHACIEAVQTPLQGDYFLLWDGGFSTQPPSRNGTFVNEAEERICTKKPYPLQNGDHIRVGNTLLTFLIF